MYIKTVLHEATVTIIHDKIEDLLKQYNPDNYDRITLTLGKFYKYGNGLRFNPNLKKTKFNKVIDILESEPGFWDQMNSESFTERSYKNYYERKSKIGSIIERNKIINSEHKTIRVPESPIDIRLSSYKEKIYTKEVKSAKALVSNKVQSIFIKEFVKIICTTNSRPNKNNREYVNYSIEIELIPGLIGRYPLNYVIHAIVAHVELLLGE
ncbi:MAG: hypothetical protein QY318_04735 [Candidatus Dojkabacteria bacterium]|nr:MAG: hypothetical protein QY318_04735 [Candidatus Dojkabacteria bacterium]